LRHDPSLAVPDHPCAGESGSLLVGDLEGYTASYSRHPVATFGKIPGTKVLGGKHHILVLNVLPYNQGQLSQPFLAIFGDEQTQPPLAIFIGIHGTTHLADSLALESEFIGRGNPVVEGVGQMQCQVQGIEFRTFLHRRGKVPVEAFLQRAVQGDDLLKERFGAEVAHPAGEGPHPVHARSIGGEHIHGAISVPLAELFLLRLQHGPRCVQQFHVECLAQGVHHDAWGHGGVYLVIQDIPQMVVGFVQMQVHPLLWERLSKEHLTGKHHLQTVCRGCCLRKGDGGRSQCRVSGPKRGAKRCRDD